MNIKEILIGTLTGALESVGESKLEAVLQTLHDKNPDQYKNAIVGGDALVKALQPIVSSTGNKIDDALLGALGDAIKTSAEANGVELPA